MPAEGFPDSIWTFERNEEHTILNEGTQYGDRKEEGGTCGLL